MTWRSAVDVARLVIRKAFRGSFFPDSAIRKPQIAKEKKSLMDVAMSTATAEARARCAARLRILQRLGHSPRTQRNPGDQD
jgi:hypothetical protein